MRFVGSAFFLVALIVFAGGIVPPATFAQDGPYVRTGALAEAVDWYLGLHGKTVNFERARPQFMAAAQKEDPLARMWLARCYQKGRVGFQTDEPEAKRLADENIVFLRNLAAGGNPEAMFLLGSAYADGLGVAEDDETAAVWYRKAADNGHALAMNNLGWAYDYGKGVGQSYDKAIFWYEKAVENGFVPSANNLAWMYMEGRGVDQDELKTIYWCQRGAEGGSVVAMIRLSEFYQQGFGVPQDDHMAGYWLKEAADRGSAEAGEHLRQYYTFSADGRWERVETGRGARADAGAATCFIATAAYGSPAERHVLTLRLFREKWLNSSPAGRWLVKQYYVYSPALAQRISGNEALRSLTRLLLAPVALAAGASLGRPTDVALVSGMILALAVLLGRRSRRRYFGGRSSNT